MRHLYRVFDINNPTDIAAVKRMKAGLSNNGTVCNKAPFLFDETGAKKRIPHGAEIHTPFGWNELGEFCDRFLHRAKCDCIPRTDYFLDVWEEEQGDKTDY